MRSVVQLYPGPLEQPSAISLQSGWWLIFASAIRYPPFDDLLAGAWQFSGAAPSGGKVYLYSGKHGTLLRTITGRVPGETFGFDPTGAGDVNGNGVPDLLLTSTWSNIKGFRSGRMFLISGK